ncbi:MAG: hypothetical protein JWO09_437 [Bacteroidetes bacterium]|nr:hypothetical protein [Bacteroidota bacterium]
MVLAVTIVLLVLSQFSTEFNLFGHKTKKVDPLGDIILKGKAKNFPLSVIVVNDSVIAKDSTAVAVRTTDPANIIDFPNDSTSALAHFFGALNEIKKKKKVRIAYFGDSMIEGDLITQDLRNEMQDVFGGAGVGFVPITSIVAGFRTSIMHQFGGWTTHTLLENMPANHVLGISGYSFVPQVSGKADTSNTANESWVKYIAVKQKHLDRFYKTRILYGKSEGANSVTVNNNNYKLDGKEPVNEVLIDNGKGVQSLSAKFQCTSSMDIFGLSMESDSGAFVDNFSFRGNSGFPLVKVPQSIYSGTNQYLGYDLIVLEYGLNAVSPDVTDFSWYERGMLNVIRHIRASFPNASILLISVGDKGYRKDGVYQTDPSVPLMVNVQRKMAEQTGCAYWSLYDAMGGEGSMVKWVEGDTVLANKDYTHFNFRGAHKVGKLLYTKLMSEYGDYNKKHN